MKDEDLEKFSKKGDSIFPKFSYVGPNLHYGRTVVLLGDSIHSVKPFFGLGANSAFEDISYLNKSLDACNDSIPHAVEQFSKTRSKEAKALVEMSHQLDGKFYS